MFHRASSFPPSWLYIIVTFGSSLLIRERTVGWGAPKPHRPYKTSRLDLLTTRLGPVQCDLHSDLHTTFQCATTCNNVQHAMERLPHWNVSLPSAASIASLASISYNIISTWIVRVSYMGFVHIYSAFSTFCISWSFLGYGAIAVQSPQKPHVKGLRLRGYTPTGLSTKD
jgi:hypothetical protein